MQLKKPPLGLLPIKFWREFNPAPTLRQKVAREISFVLAVMKYKWHGKSIPRTYEKLHLEPELKYSLASLAQPLLWRIVKCGPQH